MQYLYKRELVEEEWGGEAKVRDIEEKPHNLITDVQIQETQEANRIQLFEQIEQGKVKVEEEVKKPVDVNEFGNIETIEDLLPKNENEIPIRG